MERVSERTLLIDGFRFTKRKGGKYYRNTKNKTDIHRYVYEKYKGKIPKGYHIHHKDGDTENNNIGNLTCLKAGDHCKYHSSNFSTSRLEKLKKHCEKIRPLTKEWHKSSDGKEWHKKHYENVKSKLHEVKVYCCLECGEKFKSTQTESKFCSNKCKAKNRRKSGVDNVKRICEKCGQTFIVNKYSKTRFCSRRCSKLK